MAHESVFVRVATSDDLPAVLSVQYDAFARVSRELGIRPENLPPLTETLPELQALLAAGTRFFVALSGDTVVGSVRASCTDRRVEIGRLVVASDRVRCGIASTLMDALEQSFDDAERFVLFTGVDAVAPLALYAARGYRKTHEQPTSATTLVWLEKIPKSADR